MLTSRSDSIEAQARAAHATHALQPVDLMLQRRTIATSTTHDCWVANTLRQPFKCTMPGTAPWRSHQPRTKAATTAHIEHQHSAPAACSTHCCFLLEHSSRNRARKCDNFALCNLSPHHKITLAQILQKPGNTAINSSVRAIALSYPTYVTDRSH